MLRPDEMGWSDGNRYLRYATQLLDNGRFDKHLTAEPFYPVVWAGVYAVFGRQLITVRLFLALAGTLLCYVVYRLATLLSGRGTGLLACSIAAVYPLFIYLSRTCEYPTHLFSLLLATTIFFTVSILKQPGPVWKWTACGILLGLSALTVPTILSFSPFLAVWLLLAVRSPLPGRIFKTALLTLSCTAVLLLFSAAWYQWYGEFRVFPFHTQRSGGAFFLGNSELNYVYGDTGYYALFEEGDPELEQHPVVKQHLKIQNTGRAIKDLNIRNQYFREQASKWISENPRKFHAVLWRKFLAYWHPYVTPTLPNPDDSPLKRAIQAAAYLPMLILAVCGVWVTRREWRYTVPLLLVIFTQCLTYTLFITRVRYRSHIESLLIVFAAAAVVHMWRRIARRLSDTGQPPPDNVR